MALAVKGAVEHRNGDGLAARVDIGSQPHRQALGISIGGAAFRKFQQLLLGTDGQNLTIVVGKGQRAQGQQQYGRQQDGHDAPDDVMLLHLYLPPFPLPLAEVPLVVCAPAAIAR